MQAYVLHKFPIMEEMTAYQLAADGDVEDERGGFHVIGRRVALGMAASALALPALAQGTFPQKPIQIVVAFPPGGPTDVVARILAARMSQELGQPVIVENKAGANGNTAAAAVAKAPADGYTLLYNTSSIAISRALYRSLPYDLLRDLAPVGLTASSPLVLVVNPALPPRDPAGFAAWVKANPGQSYSSGGIGNISHLVTFLALRHLDADAVHVPYRGTAPAMADVAAGKVQFSSDTVVTALPMIQNGSVRAIAVSSAGRSPQLPDVPSMSEVGLTPKGFDLGAWQGIMAPAKTPAAVVARLNAALKAALADPAIRSDLAKQGASPTGGSAEDYARYLDTEIDFWTKVVKESGATAE